MGRTRSLQRGFSMRRERGFTLVEMLVAMAVSSIVVAALYASYDMVNKQYTKIRDVAELHQSGRGIMRMIERDIRMAGFAYRDDKGKIIYGAITEP
ncbi:MAG TPA: prepilin-type N-terminal cleavage/methylation domain-containing protein, partial [Planctomycetaceae bacterium]|nr:prepilin-type N-terminal cleavage/methylation domain-containing protein [Planctomycetaceae bacterium]